MTENKGKLIEEISNCMKLLDKAIDMHKMHRQRHLYHNGKWMGLC